jgi:Tfp pilus assembly protein PilO
MNQAKGALPILLLLVAFAAGYFVTYPQWTAYFDSKDQLHQVKDENLKLRDQKAQMDSFLSQYKSLSSEKELANKVLPLKDVEISHFLDSINKMAVNSGMFISAMDFSDPSVKASEYSITYQDMKISLTGTYPSLRAFLTQLEKHSRLIDVISITASAGEEGSGDNLEFTLHARIYYQYQ